MLTCSNCGATVREGAKFCTACGTRLNDAAPAPTAWEAPASTESTATWDAPPATATTDDKGDQDDSGSTFSWSWGDSSVDDAAKPGDATVQADEESGITIDEDETGTARRDTVVDASEVEALAAEPATSDEAAVDSQAADDEREDARTLASWAGQWDDSGSGESAADAATDASQETSRPAATTSGGEEEDTIARAERLIGELRALIPSLARPQAPARAAAGDDTPLTVADDLEGAARVGAWDDVRDLLMKARDNPRDVHSMIDLSSGVDRLLELLDDRNNLAKTAESAATRLRKSLGGDT